jgi:hypothetical protein
MQLARSGIALDPRRFGRGRSSQPAGAEVGASLSDDMKLFGSTFAAGFVFVSMLLA